MFTSAIVKVTSFCNLNCSYCYMFNLKDRSYMDKPRIMGLATVDRMLDRIEAYLSDTGRERFSLVIHGGEPLLWPTDHFNHLFERVAAMNRSGKRISISVQTNAFKVNMDVLALMCAYGHTLGISVDGPRIAHDRYRRDHRDKGSYDTIMRNVGRIHEAGLGSCIGGFLTVADPLLDVREYLDWVRSLPCTKVSVLWPIEFNHQHTPWKKHGLTIREYRAAPVYGTWFADLFTEWYRADDPSLYIRYFYDVLQVVMGSRTHGDSLVNDELNMFVVNTDGAIEYHDYFRAFGNGTCTTPLNVRDHGLPALSADPVFKACMELGEHSPRACGSCRFKSICGGGFLPGRMASTQPSDMFRRSVLCFDHMHFFDRCLELIGREASAYRQEIASCG